MNRWVIISLILVPVLGGLTCVGCCGGFIWFGMGVTTEQVRTALEADPRVMEHIGQFKSFDVNYLASLTNGEEDVFVYDAAGTKWSGRMTVRHESTDENTERILSVQFTLPSGEKVEIEEEAEE